MIYGTGVDLIEISRIRNSIQKYSGKFEERVFTSKEIDYCRSKADPSKHFAARFAAKEACSKALGTGLRMGVAWREMGVVNLPSGQPTMEVTGGAAARLQALVPPGLHPRIHVTITDDHPWAQAFVVIEAVAPDTPQLRPHRAAQP